MQRNPAAAFSLVELLVTIAIIGILAAMIFPALGRTKESGRATFCQGNLHQIGLALQMYVGESKNRMPTMYDQSAGTNFQTNLATINIVLSNQLGSLQVLCCPSDNAQIFQQTGSSYAWNNLVNAQDADHLQIFATAYALTKIPLVFDKQSFHAVLGTNRAVNYLYADGHIKNLLILGGNEVIQLDNVSKKFGQRLAVDGLTLRVPAGEIFGLLGHNGAGKSTAIGMMLGQVWPTAGDVKICGHDVAGNRRLALQKVGAIFEAPVFYDYLSGWRNLEILSHYTARCSPARIREVVAWVGLNGREKGAVRTYSHGMRARLALAQALLPQPELLILDEPGDGLDPEGIHEMRETILRLRRELGLTILLSSHLLSEMEQLCTSIAVMNQGRKVFEGTMAETRRAVGWVRLRTGNFTRATAILREAGLIEQEREEKFVLPASGIGTDQIVERLVARQEPVFEIAPEKETLENFYLSLMRK